MWKATAVVIIVLSVVDQLLWGGQVGAAATQMGWSVLHSFRIL
jgi:hypothetical protein